MMSDKQMLELAQQRHALDESTAIEEATKNEKERLAANDEKLKFLKPNNTETKAMKRAKLKKKIKTELVESALNSIFDACFGNTDFDNTDQDDAFDSTIIANFVDDEDPDELLDRFSESTQLLSALALSIREAVDDAMDDFDSTDDAEPDTYVMDPELNDNIIDSIEGDEELEDIIDAIRYKVSRATEDFVQKNIVDKLNIKDIMYSTKEKLDAIKNGDDTMDDDMDNEEISQEATMAAKRAIKEVAKRPHSVFEQMVINMTEKVISNDQLKEAFTTEAGQLDMAKIVKRSTSYYTFLEMVETLRMKKVDEAYLKEALEMN